MAIRNKKWFIVIENIFSKKRKSGIVTGDIERIIMGLASSGWSVQMHYSADMHTKVGGLNGV